MTIYQISPKTNIVHFIDCLISASFSKVWSILLFMFIGGNLLGQWNMGNPIFSEDFGNLTNATTLSITNSAFSYVRVGTSTSGTTYTNQIKTKSPSSFSGSSLVIGAKGASISTIDKTSLSSFTFGMISFSFKTPSTLTPSTDLLFSALGSGSSFGTANGFTGSQVSAGFQVYGSNFQIRSNGAWSTVQSVLANTSYQVSLIFNNSSSTLYYGNSNTPIPANKVHVWLNGTYSGEYNSATSNLAASAFRIYVNSSEYEIDNILLYNALPIVPSVYTWTGAISTNWSTATNWNPNGVPDGSIDITIPSSASLTNSPSIGSLTINAGKTLTLQSGAKLTLSGTLSNNGTVNIENGATLVQTGSGTNSGSGTYNVKQTVSGSGDATPNGRFWYLGSPVSNGLSTALLSSTGNQLWQWDETNVNYLALSSGQTLSQGKSYVLRSGQTAETINFSGTGLTNGTLNILNLSRTGNSAAFRGCHLISNPYPSYLDWDMVGKTNVSTTMYVRTALGSNYNVLETYNSFDQIGTSISGAPMTKDIAPMQGFWVKVTTDGQTGSLVMDNSMRSHQANGAGLRSSVQNFPAFLRLNMLDEENKDQVILFMSPEATSALDEHDSEKLPTLGYAQVYSTVNAKKLVINGMKNVKSKTSIPLTLELPTSKSYSFQAEEFKIEDGLILLEDRQEGVIQDLTINPIYSFFGNAGTNNTRFVVHFQLAQAPVLVGGPAELDLLGTNELTTDNIEMISDNQGNVLIRMEEAFKPEGLIKVLDASGRLIEQRSFDHHEELFNFHEKSGIYFIEVSAGKVISKKKIVILH
ncbi:MAG: hypothetical protein RIS20_1259 [Bacteroidota bacterium]